MDNNVGSTFIDDRAYRETEVLGQQFTVIDEQATKRGPQRYNYLLDKNLRGQKGVYHIDSYFSEGGEAVLFKCSNAGNVYIAKIYDNRNIVKEIDKAKRQNFINLLYNNSNPSIVSLEDYGRYDDMEFDIYPYLKNGDILSKKDMSIEYMSKVLVPQINEAFKYIHDKGIAHRDINPRNILLSDNENIMLHDFSILSVVGRRGGAYTYHADTTFGYAAPEILALVPHIKSDYYALGITLLSLLNDGRDVYDGLDQGTIRTKTMNDEIPGINRDYFKNKGNILSEYEKLLGLIHGLTILDVNNRWGYEEVCKWSKGELYFPLHVAKQNNVLNPPFPWAGKMCNTLEDMAIAIAEDWDDAKVANLRGTFTDFLVRQRPDIKNKLDNILETNDKKIDRKDTILFQTIYTLAPNLPHIYWRGVKHNDFASLAIELNNKLLHYDESFIVLLKDKILSDYIRKRENADKNFVVGGTVKKQLASIEEYAYVDSKMAYNMFIMQFLPEKVARTFIINRTRIAKLENLVDYMETTGSNFKTEANGILFNPTFGAWIWKKGEKDYLNKAKQGISPGSSNHEKSYVNLMIMLDSIDVPQLQTRIRNFVLNNNEFEYVCNLKKNLGAFNYNSKKAEAIRDKLQNTTLDASISVNQIFKNLNELYDVYKEFTYLVVENPYDIINGICEKMPDIVPKSSAGCFVYEKDNIKYAAGYVCSKADKSTYSNKSGALLQASERRKENIRGSFRQKYVDMQNNSYGVFNQYYKYNLFKILYCLFMIVAINAFVPLMGIKWETAYLISIAGSIYPLVQIVFEIKNIKYGASAHVYMQNIAGEIQTLDNWNAQTRTKCNELSSSVTNMNKLVSLEREQWNYLSSRQMETERNNLLSPGASMYDLRNVTYVITGVALAVLAFLGLNPFVNNVIEDTGLYDYSGLITVGFVILSIICVGYLLITLNKPRYLNIWLFPLAIPVALIAGALIVGIIMAVVAIVGFILEALVGIFIIGCIIAGCANS